MMRMPVMMLQALADIVATADMLSKHASTLQDDRSQIRRYLQREYMVELTYC